MLLLLLLPRPAGTAGTPVPCVLPGVVVASFADFIAKTVLVRHPAVQREGRILHSVYGHIAPRERVGGSLRAGAVVGTVVGADEIGEGVGLVGETEKLGVGVGTYDGKGVGVGVIVGEGFGKTEKLGARVGAGVGW